jgi:hypothetical protein
MEASWHFGASWFYIIPCSAVWMRLRCSAVSMPNKHIEPTSPVLGDHESHRVLLMRPTLSERLEEIFVDKYVLLVHTSTYVKAYIGVKKL